MTDDNIGRLWDTANGQLLATVGQEAPIDWARFSPDGTTVLTVGTDHTVRIYGCEVTCALPDLLNLAGGRVTRDFTPQERARYIDHAGSLERGGE